MMAVGQHLFPFRTEKLRPLTPKILGEILGKIGRRRGFTHNIFNPHYNPVAFDEFSPKCYDH
jgi:hypothetical protein